MTQLIQIERDLYPREVRVDHSSFREPVRLNIEFTTGRGGSVVMNDSDLGEELRDLLKHGARDLFNGDVKFRLSLIAEVSETPATLLARASTAARLNDKRGATDLAVKAIQKLA